MGALAFLPDPVLPVSSLCSERMCPRDPFGLAPHLACHHTPLTSASVLVQDAVRPLLDQPTQDSDEECSDEDFADRMQQALTTFWDTSGRATTRM